MDAQHSSAPVVSVLENRTVIEEKRYPSQQNADYARYLQSQRWRTLVRAVRMRAKGKCEICLRSEGDECAHLTYERIFNERMTDLLWVCKRCHRALDNGS